MMQVFDNNDDFRTYIPVNVGFDVQLLESDIDTAMRKYVLPYCSVEQWVASKTSQNAWDVELVSIVKSAAANLGMFLYLPMAKVSISSSGIQYEVDRGRQATAEDKEDLSLSLFAKGMAQVEDMLKYLEDNESGTNPAKFQAWKASTAYTVRISRLIRTTAEYRIIDSRQVFLSLLPYIEDVELDVIQDLIPETTLQKLYSRNFGTDNTKKKAYETLLYKYVQPVVANEALYRALDQLAVVIDRYGTLTIHDDTSSNKAKGSKEANIDKIERKKNGLQIAFHRRRDLMLEFILKNAAALDWEIPSEPEEVTGPYKNQIEHGSAFFGAFGR
ncbi:hypothetical protein GCM10027035_47870 [Emticicia sediminis]